MPRPKKDKMKELFVAIVVTCMGALLIVVSIKSESARSFFLFGLLCLIGGAYWIKECADVLAGRIPDPEDPERIVAQNEARAKAAQQRKPQPSLARPQAARTCPQCNEPYGEVASIGFQQGGYKCNACGAVSCDRCCYRKAKSMGRATMLCPACGSDNTSVFRI